MIYEHPLVPNSLRFNPHNENSITEVWGLSSPVGGSNTPSFGLEPRGKIFPAATLVLHFPEKHIINRVERHGDWRRLRLPEIQHTLCVSFFDDNHLIRLERLHVRIVSEVSGLSSPLRVTITIAHIKPTIRARILLLLLTIRKLKETSGLQFLTDFIIRHVGEILENIIQRIVVPPSLF